MTDINDPCNSCAQDISINNILPGVQFNNKVLVILSLNFFSLNKIKFQFKDQNIRKNIFFNTFFKVRVFFFVNITSEYRWN